MENRELTYAVTDKVATITLNRPEAMNTMRAGMYRDFTALLDKAEADDAVRVIVVTGNGRAFCAGSDLSANDKPVGQAEDIETYRDRAGLLALRVFKLNKPCIAAINGSAAGVGITMTLPMDIRIVSNKAKIGFVFTRRGIINEACSSYFLPRIVGAGKALEWLLAGRTITAPEGFEAGLFTKMTEPEDVLPTAYEYARDIAENTAPVSVALCRRLVWDMLGAGHPLTAHDFESRCMFYLSGSADAGEGIASFLEKRPPAWTMSTGKDMPPFFPFTEDPPFRDGRE